MKILEKTWIKIVLTLDTLDPVVIDLLSHGLFEAGAIGVEVDYAQGYLENHPNLFGELAEPLPDAILNHDTEIIAFFETKQDEENLRQQLMTYVGELMFSVTQTEVPNENWQENWKVHYMPQRISRFVTVVPVWETYQPDERELCVYLDPGLAFGTGNHPTTQLGVQALEMYLRGGERVLDIGTGSGVLAFVAAALGASQVWGYDLDPQAVESAQQNLLYQQTQEHALASIFKEVPIHFGVNDLLKGIDWQVDVIVANILPHILVNMLEDAYKLLTDEGYLILGGILNEKAAELAETLATYHFEIIQHVQLKGWTGYVAKKIK